MLPVAVVAVVVGTEVVVDSRAVLATVVVADTPAAVATVVRVVPIVVAVRVVMEVDKTWMFPFYCTQD
jgi:hypothetical protein